MELGDRPRPRGDPKMFPMVFSWHYPSIPIVFSYYLFWYDGLQPRMPDGWPIRGSGPVILGGRACRCRHLAVPKHEPDKYRNIAQKTKATIFHFTSCNKKYYYTYRWGRLQSKVFLPLFFKSRVYKQPWMKQCCTLGEGWNIEVYYRPTSNFCFSCKTIYLHKIWGSVRH